MALKLKIDNKEVSEQEIKRIIAHEFGHAVCGDLFDGESDPSQLDFKSDGGYIAFCHFDYRKKKFPSKYKGESFLGGAFGELLYNGRFNPWGISTDFEGFFQENKESVTDSVYKHKLLDEIDSWLWIDDDELSFRESTKVRMWRRTFFLDCNDVFNRLPEVWKKYCEFCDRIDKGEFMKVIDEIYTSGKKIIEKPQLKKYIGRVIIK